MPSRPTTIIIAGLAALTPMVWIAAGADPAPAEEHSFVVNGDFEQADPADPSRPAGWDKPDGLGVQWAAAPRAADETAHGRAIRMDTSVSEMDLVAQWKKNGITEWDIPKPAPNPVATTYGLSYYSTVMPVQSGQTYRIEFDFMGGGGGKVWVRCYGLYAGEKRRRYETIVDCNSSPQRWTRQAQDFNPTRLTPEVTEMKVMLYAYWPPGVYWFDNVRLVPVPATNAPVR